MTEYKCRTCGKTFLGQNESHTYRFCSQRCAARYRWEVMEGQDYDPDLNWKYEDSRWQCPYHQGVACRTRRCGSCGWNPAVEKLRNLKLGVMG